MLRAVQLIIKKMWSAEWRREVTHNKITQNIIMFLYQLQTVNKFGYRTVVWPSRDIKEISGSLGTMYVVRWATKWTSRGSSHGVTPAWWTNINAYKVPLLRVFLGRETFTILEKTEKIKENDIRLEKKQNKTFFF